MKIATFIGSAAAIALTAGLAPPTQAKIVKITYKGAISSGRDLTGVFGTANANLTGDSFTAVFTINTSINANLYASATTENFYGGTKYLPAHGGKPAKGTTSPVTATLTINGHTIAVPSAYWGRVWDSSWTGTASELNLEVQDKHTSGTVTYSDDLENRIFSTTHAIDPTPDFTQPLSYKLQAGDTTNLSAFTDTVYDSRTGAYSVKVTVAFKPTSVSIASPVIAAQRAFSEVPEPAAWAMMTLGVAMIGIATRRRKASMAAAA